MSASYAIEFRLMERNSDKSFTELTKEYSGILYGLQTEEEAREFFRYVSDMINAKRRAI